MRQMGACGRRSVNPINLLIDRRAAARADAGLNRQRTDMRNAARYDFVYSTRAQRLSTQ